MLRIFITLLLTGVIGLAFLGCGEDSMTSVDEDNPSVSNVVVEMNPGNALSARINFEVEDAIAAKVVYTKDMGQATELTLETPYYPVGKGTNTIVPLGLDAETLYRHVVVVRGEDGVETESEAVEMMSGALPAYLAGLSIEVSGGRPDPPPPPPGKPAGENGYTLINIREDPEFYSVAFDEEGVIRWYRKWDLVGGFFQQLPNDNFAAFVGTTTGFHPSYGYYEEFTPAGEFVARHQAPIPFYTDNHEFLLTPDANGWKSHLISYDLRFIDTTSIGGVPNARIAGHQILRMGPEGNVEFMWNSWDHFGLESWVDGPAGNRAQPLMDYDHPNSLEIDLDGHYIYSVRNFGQVIKIDSQTGDVIWRLGPADNLDQAGLNDFTFVDDPWGGFSAQHFARILPNGNLLLFDNGMNRPPQETRAVEYALDTEAMTATLVWSYQRNPGTYAAFLGSIQRLANGNTLVGYGANGIATEVSPARQVVWEAVLTRQGAVVRSYRIIRIADLYEYRQP